MGLSDDDKTKRRSLTSLWLPWTECKRPPEVGLNSLWMTSQPYHQWYNHQPDNWLNDAEYRVKCYREKGQVLIIPPGQDIQREREAWVYSNHMNVCRTVVKTEKTVTKLANPNPKMMTVPVELRLHLYFLVKSTGCWDWGGFFLQPLHTTLLWVTAAGSDLERTTRLNTHTHNLKV